MPPAIALACNGRGGANIVMLGPFPSGKVQVVLFTLGVCAIGLSFLVFLTAAVSRCEPGWLGLFLSLVRTDWSARNAEIAPATVGAGDFTVVRSGGRASIAFDATRLEIPAP
jgi:hypothetical protein